MFPTTAVKMKKMMTTTTIFETLAVIAIVAKAQLVVSVLGDLKWVHERARSSSVVVGITFLPMTTIQNQW